MTLAQSDYCINKKYDTQDPRCGQVILSGNFIFVSDDRDGQAVLPLLVIVTVLDK